MGRNPGRDVTVPGTRSSTVYMRRGCTTTSTAQLYQRYLRGETDSRGGRAVLRKSGVTYAVLAASFSSSTSKRNMEFLE